ncbi:MAG: LolA family protein [Caulobacteraceae bacterium]
MPNALSRRSALLAFAAALAAAPPALAKLTADDDALVAKAVAYLDGLKSVKATFVQSEGRGRPVQGEVWLSRPGRARFAYDGPSGLLVTADGETVVVSNARLKTFQRFPLKSTPLAMLLTQHIRLDKGAHVTRVDRSPGGFSITAKGGRGVAQGEITLYFAETPVRLLGWAIRDAEARLTRVTLGPLTPVSPPPASFFTQSDSRRDVAE